MFNVEPRDSEESPYQYDEPKKPLSPKRLANFAVVATGAVASVAFGLQVVGPAIAHAIYPSATQTEAGTSQPTPVTEVSKAAFKSSPSSEFTPPNPVVTSSRAASLGNLAGLVATESALTPPPTATATQIQLPAGAPSFGNLSSATPYAGSSGTWKSSNEQEDDDDDDDDERKKRNDRDDKEDDDRDEDDD
jgi:hypothetical protein